MQERENGQDIASEWGEAQAELMHRQGWCVLDTLLKRESIEQLGREVDASVVAETEDLLSEGGESFGLTVLGERYYVGGRWKRSSFLKELLLGGELGQLAKRI